MKNIIFLLILIPITSFSQEKLSIGGTYRFGNDIEKESIGEILVVPKADNHAVIYISTSKQAPSYSTFYLLTEVEVIGNKAFYQPKTGNRKLEFEFFKDKIITTDPHSITISQISLDKTSFIKVNDTIPTYFWRGDGQNIALNKTVDDFKKNYYSNTSIWEFIGVWQYGQGLEALNISKAIASDSIVIQYNSSADGFEDRYITNCVFKNGKVYGDYYGGKENVIVEIEKDNLLLTIDPFHDFQPIQKQVFKKYPQSMYKYCSQQENTYVEYANKKVDSLPPGYRVLVKSELERNNHFIPLFYNNKFSKEGRYILYDQLSDIKPLFISEGVDSKDFNTLNESERFVKQIYTPEKLKENIKEESLPEQNSVGQKKLFIDAATFTKLGLERIGKHYTDVFITGTVDLSKIHRSIVVDFQSENEYYTYLVNYDLKGKYIDHILIGRDDYVESFTPIKSIFTPGEIYVNAQIDNLVADENDMGNSFYRTFETKRYILNKRGQFIASNHSRSFMERPDTSLKVVSQKIESSTFGTATISLFLNFIDTDHITGGYASSMHTTIETEEGMELTIPMNLSEVCGFYDPPYGDFSGVQGMLQKLFSTTIYDGIDEQLYFKLSFSDVTNDGVDELFLEISDKSYVIEPKESLCFVNEGGSWVYSEFNKKANLFNDEIDMPYEMIFKSYYRSGFPPYSIGIDDAKKQELLLKSNENLIYTFKVKNSEKRVSIGVTENCKYLVYRFGTKDKIEFEYIAEYNSETKRFNYFIDNQTFSTPRNLLENISFQNNNYQYAVYSNYLETNMEKYDSILQPNSSENIPELLKGLYEEGSLSETDYLEINDNIKYFRTTPRIPFRNGEGIMIRNLKTGEKLFLEADENTIQGYMGLIKQCIKEQ